MLKMRVNPTHDWNRLRYDISQANVAKVMDDVDKEIGEIAKDIASDASANAPVLTGYMRDTLKDSYERTHEMTWAVMPDVYGNLPYLWVQNFNHRTKAYFFTTAFNKQYARFDRRLISVLERSFGR